MSEVEVTLRVNGASRIQLVDPRMSLLDLLRERLGLTGANERQPVPVRRLREHRPGDHRGGRTPHRPDPPR